MRPNLTLASAGLLAVLAAVAVPTTATTGFTVLAVDFQFLPEVLAVPSGSTVTWVQGTATFIPHTVTAPGMFDFDPGNVGNGNVIGSYTFNEPAGTVVTYLCKPHATLGMRGVIVVV